MGSRLTHWLAFTVRALGQFCPLWVQIVSIVTLTASVLLNAYALPRSILPGYNLLAVVACGLGALLYAAGLTSRVAHTAWAKRYVEGKRGVPERLFAALPDTDDDTRLTWGHVGLALRHAPGLLVALMFCLLNRELDL